MKLLRPTRLFGAATAALLSLSVLHAQEPPPGKPADGGPRKPPTVEERIERMKKDLEITDDQVAKIKPILEDARTQMDKIREEANGDRDAMREKARTLWDSTKAKIDEILTPEQKAKADEMRQKRMDKAKKGDGDKADSGDKKE